MPRTLNKQSSLGKGRQRGDEAIRPLPSAKRGPAAPRWRARTANFPEIDSSRGSSAPVAKEERRRRRRRRRLSLSLSLSLFLSRVISRTLATWFFNLPHERPSTNTRVSEPFPIHCAHLPPKLQQNSRWCQWPRMTFCLWIWIMQRRVSLLTPFFEIDSVLICSRFFRAVDAVVAIRNRFCSSSLSMWTSWSFTSCYFRAWWFISGLLFKLKESVYFGY